MTEPPLVAGETLIADQSEILRRQIHPDFLKDGLISRQAFDTRNKQVSVTRDAIVTAEQAYFDYPNQTIGSCVVTVADVVNCGLRTVDDSGVEGVPEGHAYIDMRGCSNRKARDMAMALQDIANRNGITNP